MNVSTYDRETAPAPLDLARKNSLRTKAEVVPSLLKWTGSKRSQATRIAAFAPAYDRYYEPFLGSGALMFLLARSGSVGADLYPPLASFWVLVRDKPQLLVDDYSQQWSALQNDFPGYYYFVRERFNLTQRAEDLNFLMRTCVNGIARFSKAGHFNNSFHLSRKGMHPLRFSQIVAAWTLKLQGVRIHCRDFEHTLAEAKEGDFVYLDPPYAGNKQRYRGSFAVSRLLGVLDDLNCRGVKWALSFDGSRGQIAYGESIPRILYRRKISLTSGNSAVAKVLNGPIEMVTESLYLNY